MPLEKIRYVLMGESPYPRAHSANGYAFWDQAVDGLWSETGLSKPVNRATSLRNIIKMLLVAKGDLAPHDTTQDAIAAIDKTPFVQTNTAFFENFQHAGFLLLNASLVFREKRVPQDAKAWLPFMTTLLSSLNEHKPDVELLLFGNIAKKINQLDALKPFKRLQAEHPYNLSFITNNTILDFFRPLSLLDKR